MFCPQCGASNPDSSKKCAQCGGDLTKKAYACNAQPQKPQKPQKPKLPSSAKFHDWIALNIVAVVLNMLCCGVSSFASLGMSMLFGLLFHLIGFGAGVIGIIIGGKARKAYSYGQEIEAGGSGRVAGILCIVSFVGAVLAGLVALFFVIVYGAGLGIAMTQ